MAKWGDLIFALNNGNLVVIPGCGSEERKGGIK
jgi:hypothetical protein